MEDKQLHIKGLVKKVDDNDNSGILEAVIGSSNVVDRMGEVVDQDGLDLKNFKKNPVLLWAHNSGLGENRPPIGKVIKTWLEGVSKKKLMFKLEFDMEDEFAAMIYNKYKKGFLSAFSIGFQPLEMVENTYTKSELLEISAVPVPANPEALVQLRGLHPVKTFEEYLQKGIKEDKTVSKEDKKEEVYEDKSTVPYSATPTMPENVSWDAGEAKKEMVELCTKDGVMDWKEFAKGFAWVDSENPEKMSSYKLPHHEADDGIMKTNWRGVAAGMAALLGANGGVDIPEADRKGVYEHLKKHYAQFDKEVPEFRAVEDQILKGEEVGAYIDSMVARKLRILKAKEEAKNKETEVKQKQDDAILPELQEAMKIMATVSNIALKKIKDSKLKGGEMKK